MTKIYRSMRWKHLLLPVAPPFLSCSYYMKSITSVSGYFMSFFSFFLFFMKWDNQIRLNWNGKRSRLQYDALNIHWICDWALPWLNFPRFFTVRRRLHVKQRQASGASPGRGPRVFYLTPSRHGRVPLDLRRCRGMYQAISAERGECETCKPNTHLCEVISRITVWSY